MEFELRELRYFVALAEELHFARAAARVGINQSPLSKAISVMEANMGVELFVRTRRKTQLTAVGRALLDGAQRILAEVERAQRSVAAAASGRQGRLRIGVCNGLAVPRMARLFAQSRAEDSQLELSVVQKTWQEQERDLRAELLDIGFATGLVTGQCFQSSEAQSDILVIRLWEDSEVVALRADSPLAKRRVVTPAQIGKDFGPILVPRDSGGGVGDVMLLRLGLLGGFEFVASVELLLTLVTAGCGVGLISSAYTEGLKRADVVFRPLNVKIGINVATYVLHRREDESPVVARLIERAQKMAESIVMCLAPPHAG